MANTLRGGIWGLVFSGAITLVVSGNIINPLAWGLGTLFGVGAGIAAKPDTYALERSRFNSSRSTTWRAKP